MVELKVDSDKLPKADDLRARYFLSTFAVTVNDQDIRLVTRQAFLSHYDLIAVGGSMAVVLPAVQAAREAARRAQAANEQAAGGQAPGGGRRRRRAGRAAGRRPAGPVCPAAARRPRRPRRRGGRGPG